MASGVTVDENVLTIFNDMKVRKANVNEEEKSKRKKAVLFCLSDDKKHIIMEEGSEILQGEEGDPYLKAPESAPLKSKMIYASSKDAIKKKFTGIKHEWQVNGLEDIKDRKTLAEKLGGASVVTLEGKPLND
ncbi:hypothetical protein cypCar_00003412 [Cyprinus carpio]|nr:hypothetical protein cypCar_00003412 [Cyprinus carpio]